MTDSKHAHLLGKQVRVTLNRPIDKGGSLHIVEGKLLAFDDGGAAVVQQDDGFVMHCWPMLDIERTPSCRKEGLNCLICQRLRKLSRMQGLS